MTDFWRSILIGIASLAIIFTCWSIIILAAASVLMGCISGAELHADSPPGQECYWEAPATSSGPDTKQCYMQPKQGADK